LLALVVFSLLTAIIFGQQSDNGSLTGTITDPNGAVVPNATVTVTNLDARSVKTVTTNQDGRWTVFPLKLGNYEVKAEATGFKGISKHVTVGSGTNTVDLILGIVGQDISIEVQAQDQSTTVSSEQSAVTSTTITGKRVEQMPAPTRSVFNLLGNDSSVS